MNSHHASEAIIAPMPTNGAIAQTADHSKMLAVTTIANTRLTADSAQSRTVIVRLIRVPRWRLAVQQNRVDRGHTHAKLRLEVAHTPRLSASGFAAVIVPQIRLKVCGELLVNRLHRFPFACS